MAPTGQSTCQRQLAQWHRLWSITQSLHQMPHARLMSAEISCVSIQIVGRLSIGIGGGMGIRREMDRNVFSKLIASINST